MAVTPIGERLAYTVPELCVITPLSRNTVYGLIADGILKATRVGRKLVVSRAEIERFLGQNVGEPGE